MANHPTNDRSEAPEMMELFQTEWCPASRRVRQLPHRTRRRPTSSGRCPVDRADRDALLRRRPAPGHPGARARGRHRDGRRGRDPRLARRTRPRARGRRRATARRPRRLRRRELAGSSRRAARAPHVPRHRDTWRSPDERPEIGDRAARRRRAWRAWPLERILFAMAGTVTLVSRGPRRDRQPVVAAARRVRRRSTNWHTWRSATACVAACCAGCSASSGGVPDERLDVAARVRSAGSVATRRRTSASSRSRGWSSRSASASSRRASRLHFQAPAGRRPGPQSVSARTLIQQHFAGNASSGLMVVVLSPTLRHERCRIHGSHRQGRREAEGRSGRRQRDAPRPGASICQDGHTAIVLAGAGAPPKADGARRRPPEGAAAEAR